MKLKKVRVAKTIKIGMPNYSSIHATCDLTFDVDKDEDVDWDELWDTVNHQLSIQSGHFDPAWIETKGFKEFIKIIFRVPKTRLMKNKYLKENKRHY